MRYRKIVCNREIVKDLSAMGFSSWEEKQEPTFPGMENAPAERKQARAEAEGDELTAELLKPKADISKRAGKIERESPLFWGKGENPGLF